MLCVLNLGTRPVHLPAAFGTDVLVASGDDLAVLSDDGVEHVVVGGETAVWLG